MSAALKPEDDKLEIIAVDDPPATEAKPEIKVDDALASLKSQLEAERAASAAAIERAKAAETQVIEARAESVKFQNTAQQAQYDAVSRALEAQNGVIAAAEAEYQAALDAGDHARAAKANTTIARATARQTQLEDGKAQMEAMRQRAAQQPPPQRQAPQGAQFSARTEAWLAANPMVRQDPVLGAEVHAAHLRAVAAGFTPDTDPYFDFIEQRTGLKQADPPTRQNQRQPMYSAPVQQQARQPSGKQANGTFYMLPWMRDAAKVAGVSEESWAREYKKMQDDNDFL